MCAQKFCRKQLKGAIQLFLLTRTYRTIKDNEEFSVGDLRPPLPRQLRVN